MAAKNLSLQLIITWMFCNIRLADSIVSRFLVRRQIHHNRNFAMHLDAAMPLPPSRILGKQVIVLAGATSVGKSAVAAQLCKIIDSEIILADCVQVYKHLNIGSNKPTAAEMETIPHHMVDLKEPHEGFSCGDFVREAVPIIYDILDRGKTPVIVGGSTMWIQWLIHGMPDAPKATLEVVELALGMLKPFQDSSQWDDAADLVRKYDRVRVDKLAKNDWYRLHRYLEIGLLQSSETEKENSRDDSAEHSLKREREEDSLSSEVTNGEEARKGSGGSEDESSSSLLTGERCNSLQGLDVRCYFLSEERDELYHCIDNRCEDMLVNGLLNEVTDLLLKEHLTPDSLVSKAIGYRQSINYLCRDDFEKNNPKVFEAFIRDFATATRQYAKRQLQWYRKDKEFLWVKIALVWAARGSVQADEAETDRAGAVCDRHEKHETILIEEVGDVVYLPSKNPRPTDPPKGVEWEVVQIVRTTENLFPTVADKDDEEKLARLFSIPELKALAAVRESKDGTFDMSVCGLRSPEWSAQEFSVRAAEGKKRSTILKTYTNYLRTDNPKFRELLCEADLFAEKLRKENLDLVKAFNGELKTPNPLSKSDTNSCEVVE